ncbi:MAG: hypothetical protein V3S24_10885, partial [Candidatus Tectomicrobia bacterium]
SATDAQIPDDITINFAATAGDADTLDSLDSTEFALVVDFPSVPACLTEENGDAVFEGCNVHIRSGSGGTDDGGAVRHSKRDFCTPLALAPLRKAVAAAPGSGKQRGGWQRDWGRRGGEEPLP